MDFLRKVEEEFTEPRRDERQLAEGYSDKRNGNIWGEAGGGLAGAAAGAFAVHEYDEHRRKQLQEQQQAYGGYQPQYGQPTKRGGWMGEVGAGVVGAAAGAFAEHEWEQHREKKRREEEWDMMEADQRAEQERLARWEGGCRRMEWAAAQMQRAPGYAQGAYGGYGQAGSFDPEAARREERREERRERREEEREFRRLDQGAASY
eukprot:jgi/Botrbrau1/13106/Bobra.0187s0064.1